MSAKSAAKSYPKIGVIDGGLGTALSPWVIDRWGFLADKDADLKHGSFIGGLAVLDVSLNCQQCCPEPDGAELVDVDVFHDESTNAFAYYYPQGLPRFLDEVEAAIRTLRARSGVRIFNMSLNDSRPISLGQYDLFSARLDAIAEENNVIFFILTRNIVTRYQRPEWPSDDSGGTCNLGCCDWGSIDLTFAERPERCSVGSKSART